MHNLAVQIVRFADDNQPGRVECEFVDAEDRSPSLRDIKDSEHFGFGEKVKTAFFDARKQLIGSCVAALAFTFSLSCSAQEFNLMPWPARIEQREGFLKLDQLPRFEVKGGDERVQYAIAHFRRQLDAETKLSSRSSVNNSTAPLLVIRCDTPGQKLQALGEDESYSLLVDESKIELTAGTPLGVLRGVETLLQLIQKDKHDWIIPAVRVEDRPRFPWRGLMVDVSRHFIPLEVIKRNIDGMAAVKLNTLHLHLSDDEGFRVESRNSPKLQELASDGQYYTQHQIRELLSYARERGVRVVPEFDVPGHAVSWLIAHPNIASAPPPAHLVRGMSDAVRPPIDPTIEETYQVLDSVLGEMASLFPDPYFHVGGDEVDGKYWDGNERIQEWMRAHAIKDNHDLQTYFSKRVQVILAKHGKHMEGWDDILNPDLPKDTLVQSWRGPDTLATAAQMGFPTILSAGWYLDLMYPASRHYAVEPLSGLTTFLSDAQKALILGGEAAQWTEYATPENIDNRIWPRLGAIAERLWSPASVTGETSMYKRLEALSISLEQLKLLHNLNSRKMLDDVAGKTPRQLFETLSAVVEPVKEYEREKTQAYSTQTPLNRLVDAVSPESNVGRELNILAQQAIQDPDSRLELRKWFKRWRDNDARLQPFLYSSSSLQELIPLSHELCNLGSTGLEALDNIEAGSRVTGDKRTQQLASIDDAAKPHAELFLVVTSGVRQLVAAEPLVE
jgi:hexosaminidase